MDLPVIPQICIAFLFCTLFTYCFKRAKVIPGFTGSVPWILVNLHRFHEITVQLMERYNGTYACSGKWYGISDFIGTVDPANINYITTSNFANYPKGDEHRKMFDIMGYGVFNSDDQDWKYNRRLIHTPIKSRNFINHSINTTHAKLEQVLVPLLKHASDHNSGLTLDVQDVFQRFSLDVACKSLAGQDTAYLSIEDSLVVPFFRAMVDFGRGVTYRLVFPQVVNKLQLLTRIGPEYKLSLARGVIRHYISSLVSNKRHQVSNSNTSEGDDQDAADLLSLLMKDVATADLNDELFFEDIILQLMVAGRDTTSSAMTWFIWLVVMHPEVEKKIRNEIRANIPGANAEESRVFNSDETSNLVYLHAALYESMRLYPPVPFQYKSPKEPDVLPSGHSVHPKTKILMPLYAMARMKAIWGDNCSKFNPERWITERGTLKHEPENKFFIFYAGPRSCMGKEVAMIQMKMVTATLIHNFRFQLAEGQNIQPDLSMILRMQHGLKAKVYNRWS